MKSRLLLLAGFGLMLGLTPSLRAADAAPTLAGSWKIDVARSTPIRPWDVQTMTIAVRGDSVVITRSLAWGTDRKVTDTTAAVTDGKTATANPVGFWLDTWYTNVYMGGDRLKRVTAEWLDGGRVLKLETNFALEAQQGDHPVHLYDEYRLSTDGQTLRLYELRSTRDEPLVYIFTRQ